MPVWRDEAPPRDPRHVFNRHGLTAAGDANWLTSSPEGAHKFPVGYFLDPGHPAAAEYLTQIQFDGWIRWEKRHAHGRHLAVGVGAYRNSPAHTLAQVERARGTDNGHRVAGVSFYSYAA